MPTPCIEEPSDENVCLQNCFVPRAARLLAAVLLTMVASGATCMPKRTIPEFQPQVLFSNQPSTDQLIEVINRSRGVQSLQSNFVTVNPNKIRNLDATLVWQRERRFRMAGGISRMLGNNFEVGSNDEWFWMAIRDGMNPQLFVARHEEFDAQPHRRILPISPLWIVEALGVVSIEPHQLMGEPAKRPDGMVELNTMVPSPTGTYTRTLVVDPQYGFTRQIFLRDPTGRLVATANQTQHEYYPSISMSLPHRVVVQLTPALDPPTEIDITIGKYAVNHLDPNQTAGYEAPNPAGYEVIQLVQYNQGMAQAVTPIQVTPPNTQPNSAFRGVDWDGPLFR
jgi:hypothetical protein